MWSDASLQHCQTGLRTLAHLVAALQKRMEKSGEDKPSPADVIRALGPIQDALDGTYAAAEWDVE